MTAEYLGPWLDGEGSFGLAGGLIRPGRAWVQVSNTHKPTLDDCAADWGGSVLMLPKKSSKHRTAWKWQVHGSAAERILRSVLPHLREKRLQAKLCLMANQMKPADRVAIKEALHELKNIDYGKPEDLIVWPSPKTSPSPVVKPRPAPSIATGLCQSP